jgi:hypothetical protein
MDDRFLIVSTLLVEEVVVDDDGGGCCCCCLAVFNASRRIRNSSNLDKALEPVVAGVLEDAAVVAGVDDSSIDDTVVEVVVGRVELVVTELLRAVVVDDDANSRRNRNDSNLDKFRLVTALGTIDAGRNKAQSMGHEKYCC